MKNIDFTCRIFFLLCECRYGKLTRRLGPPIVGPKKSLRTTQEKKKRKKKKAAATAF